MLGVIESFLGWSILINWCILAIWFGMLVFARGWIFQLHARWFHISASQFDQIHYRGIIFAKVMVLLLNVTPWLALQLLK